MNDALGAPQSVLVLGATSEIAEATMTLLVQRRTRSVILAARRPAALGGQADRLRALGADRVEAMAFDADDTASHGAFVDDAFTRHGDIDATIVAFGVLGDQAEAEHDPEVALGILRTNFLGAASVGLHVARHLRRQGHGTLAVLSSVAAVRARRSNFVYGSSKAGLDAFFQGLGDSLVGSGARVLIVRPGFVHTKMTAGLEPAPFATTPEKVADVLVRALEAGAEEAWAPPPLRFVMSGLRHLPRPVFRRISG